MEQTVYEKLADVLDSLPNGFPRSESGVELDLLKKYSGLTRPSFSAA